MLALMTRTGLEAVSSVKRRAADTMLAALIVLAATSWTIECRAQGKLPRVGVLAVSEANVQLPWFSSFTRRLAERGWAPEKDVVLEYRFARGEDLRFNAAAEELVTLRVDVIYAISAPAAHAAYMATRTIPIVTQDYTTDPVAAGYAESYGRPGKNVTGVFLDAPEFAGKWIELLRRVLPALQRVVILWDPSPGTTHLKALQRTAERFDLDLQVHEVRAPEDIDKAFSMIRGRPQAMIVLPSPMIFTHSARIADLALRNRLPATSIFRVFPEAGGFLSYGPDGAEVTQRNALQIAKILDGAKPGDLPIERPSKFDLVINLKTAKALGIAIPQSVLVQADDMIR